MGKLMSEKVATYDIFGKSVDVVLCWEEYTDHEREERMRENDGVLPDDSFHDFMCEGYCLNMGEPWYRDGNEEVPSVDDVIWLVTETGTVQNGEWK